MTMHAFVHRQRGVALILVLWVMALMAILLGSFALMARTENLEARHMFDGTTARYGAEAGLERAVYELRNPDVTTRWVCDGRPYEFDFENTHIHLEILDESGKIDLNTADDTLLQSLFMSVGIDQMTAASLSAAIQDWRDGDDIPLPNGAEVDAYKSAGLSYGPRNAPFQTDTEVQQVMGMSYELYQRIEPSITIYSGSSQPNPAYAPIEVLRALPGMTEDLAQQLIAARQQIAPGQGATANLTLPDGTPIMVTGGGNTYTIKSRATLTNGASATIDASVRLGGVGVSGRPYTVLRWRDDEKSR